jgi:hypothetical protein
MLQSITFDKSAALFILEVFGKVVNKEGFLIEKETGEYVLSRHGEHVSINEFGGIAKGSELYLKSDISSMIEFIEKQP